MEGTHPFFRRLAYWLWHPWIGALIVILFFSAWYFLLRSSDASKEFFTVHEGTFAEVVHVSGSVEASHDVDLGFSQSGRVARVSASVGDRVQRGEILAEVENDDLKAAVEFKQASLDSQKAKLASLEAGTRPEQIAVTNAQVDSDRVVVDQSNQALINAIQNAYTTSDTIVRNIMDLFFKNAHSGSPQLVFTATDASLQMNLESDRLAIESMLHEWLSDLSSLSGSDIAHVMQAASQANTNLNTMANMLIDANSALGKAIPSVNASQDSIASWTAAVSEARGSVNLAITTLTSAVSGERSASSALVKDEKNLALQKAGATAEDISGQIASVSAANADLSNAKAQLDKTIIRAPFDGTITKMDAKVGEILSPSSPQISMISEGLFHVVAYVPEVDIANLSVGNMATATLDAYGQKEFFPATVVAIDPSQTKIGGISTYKVTLQFLQNDPRLKSGMTANLMITTSTKESAISVPQSAIFYEDGVALVDVKHDRAIEQRQVSVGRVSIGTSEIVAGLQEGDQIVLNP